MQQSHRGKSLAKRWATVVLGGGLALTALVGCSAGNPGPSATTTTTTVSGDKSLQAVLDKGEVNVGACLAQAPWGQLASDGSPEGFDVDVANYIGKALGVKVKIVEVNGAGRVPALQSGQADVMSCTFTITDERKQQVDFANPTIVAGTSLLVKKGSGIHSIADLSGRKVGVTKGGTAEQLVAQLNPKAVLQEYEVPADLFLALQQGQVDGVVDVASTIDQAAAQNRDLVIAVDGKVGPKTYFALGVKKGSKALLDKVNTIVAEFHKSGTDVKFYKKWFGKPPTWQFTDMPKTVNVS